MEADQDRDGKISFDEFTKMVEGTDVSMSMTLGKFSNPLVHRTPNNRTCLVMNHNKAGTCCYYAAILLGAPIEFGHVSLKRVRG